MLLFSRSHTKKSTDKYESGGDVNAERWGSQLHDLFNAYYEDNPERDCDEVAVILNDLEVPLDIQKAVKAAALSMKGKDLNNLKIRKIVEALVKDPATTDYGFDTDSLPDKKTANPANDPDNDNTGLRKPTITENIKTFMPTEQLEVVRNNQEIADQIAELDKTIEKMPETYGQEGKGDKAVAYLHYFTGDSDWYIVEKDAGKENEDGTFDNSQTQAYGMVSLHTNYPELGYISIEELKGLPSVQLDLYFTPKTLAEIKEEKNFEDGGEATTDKPSKAKLKKDLNYLFHERWHDFSQDLDEVKDGTENLYYLIMGRQLGKVQQEQLDNDDTFKTLLKIWDRIEKKVPSLTDKKIEKVYKHHGTDLEERYEDFKKGGAPSIMPKTKNDLQKDLKYLLHQQWHNESQDRKKVNKDTERLYKIVIGRGLHHVQKKKLSEDDSFKTLMKVWKTIEKKVPKLSEKKIQRIYKEFRKELSGRDKSYKKGGDTTTVIPEVKKYGLTEIPVYTGATDKNNWGLPKNTSQLENWMDKNISRVPDKEYPTDAMKQKFLKGLYYQKNKMGAWGMSEDWFKEGGEATGIEKLVEFKTKKTKQEDIPAYIVYNDFWNEYGAHIGGESGFTTYFNNLEDATDHLLKAGFELKPKKK